MVRGAKLLLLKNTITMEKFLTVTATEFGLKEIIPISNFVTIRGNSNTDIDIAISPGSNSSTLDVITITLSAADPLWAAASSIQKGSMVDILQQLVAEALSRGTWSDPFVDITNRIPIPIYSVTPSSI